jgi:hypothetical protein
MKKAIYFELSFTHLKKKYKATGSKFKFSKCMMYRVVVPSPKNKYPDVHILYEINEPNQRFFWYGADTKQGSVTKAIAKAIEKNGY